MLGSVGKPETDGKEAYPNATELLITGDGRGRSGSLKNRTGNASRFPVVRSSINMSSHGASSTRPLD